MDDQRSTQTEGIDVEPVTRWLSERVSDLQTPLSFDLITGGHSNLTYRVIDAAGRRWVLRRPPLGQVLATAHDMSREHRIIAALQDSAVPIPPVVGLCTDESVNGAPFYVMEFVDGVVVRDVDEAGKLTPDIRSRASESLVDTLVAIHEVDVDRVGLGDLGRKEQYIERQLKRWYTQFQSSQTREVPVVDELHAILSARIPDQGPATIVHGDYRLDNTMLASDGTVAAVLDWEICTLGDPLADLGLLNVYWADPGEPTHSGLPSATSIDGFWSKAQLSERYAERSGRDISQLGFYIAFGYWKLACIIEGVFARYQGGAMGDRGGSDAFDFFGEQVIALAERGRDSLGGAT